MAAFIKALLGKLMSWGVIKRILKVLMRAYVKRSDTLVDDYAADGVDGLLDMDIDKAIDGLEKALEQLRIEKAKKEA